MKSVRELKRRFPAYKRYIEFYEKTGFTKPKNLPPPPKWLIEGKAPPANFKIPKIIITEIEEQKPKPQAKQPAPKPAQKPAAKPAPKKEQAKQAKKAPELPLIVRKNKELKNLLGNKAVKTVNSILGFANDIIEKLESDSAKEVMDGRIDLDEEDDLVKRTISILEPDLYLKNISVESDPTGLKEKFEEKKEKEMAKKKKAK